MPDDAALSIETEREVIASEDTPVPHLLLMMDSLTLVQDLQPLAERTGHLFLDGAGSFLSGVPFDRLFLRRQHRRGQCVPGYVISRRRTAIGRRASALNVRRAHLLRACTSFHFCRNFWLHG
jgi:hypothetical protein